MLRWKYVGQASKSTAGDSVPVRVRSPAPRRSKLCIACSDFFTKVRARSRRCSSFPNRTRFAGLRFGFGCKPGSVASIVLQCSTWPQSPLCDHVFLCLRQKKTSSARSRASSFQIESAARDLAAAQRAKPFEPQEIERMITSADWTFRLPVVQKRSPLFIRQVRLSLRLSVPAPSDSPRHLSSPAT